MRGALLALGAMAIVAGALVADELRTSARQARYFSTLATEMRFSPAPGPSASIRFPRTGPYDHRLGYADLPSLIERLSDRGFHVGSQARQTPALVRLIERGYSAPYREKTRAGLMILDCRGESLFAAAHPRQGYGTFEAIPAAVVRTLLFIENRTLLDASQTRRNPAIEWPRLARALLAQGARLVRAGDDAPGASTLATQMEKYRHSASGVTLSVREKFRQMYSASLRAYAGGEDTTAARRAIVLDYLNTLPLAAVRGYGEVNGLADGLWAWYGLDPAAVDAALRSWRHDAGYDLAALARAYRAVLSLLIAQRRPTALLGAAHGRLHALTDSYLRLLADAGIVSPALRDAALATRLTPRTSAPALPGRIEDWKAAYNTRTELLAFLGAPRFYDLERLDLEAASTFDAKLQQIVRRALQRLVAGDANGPGAADAARLVGGDRSNVIYSFTLYERGANMNYVRVQTDTTALPFDMNENARIELGSTAKLRTLATYLEIVASLHRRYAPLDAAALARIGIDRRDRLSRWALDYLSRENGASLETMLEAALERRYSASPRERFFTAGGRHRFSNFSGRDNGRTPTVREAFRASINLPFIRLMRDIVDHHVFGPPRAAGPVLDDPAHPERAAYLTRFADYEGRIFLARFHERHAASGAAQALEALAARALGIPARLAVIFRSVRPGADFGAFAGFMRRHAAKPLDDDALSTLYARYAIDRYSLHDRGYIADVHPLELWLLGFLARAPQARLEDAVAASTAQRQAVYGWLWKRSQRSQNRRIRTLLEIEAFDRIHAQWARLGYPFDALVPSYATAIGVSGDNPAALSELIGIVLNGGVRQPTVRVRALHFARGTPYETLLERGGAGAARVLSPAVAAALRTALAGVVDTGTARRLRGAYADLSGEPLAVGGKTGTGDNRYKLFGARGALLGSRSVSRTATFAFFLGDRHFGAVTAYVPAPHARSYRFTSALPVQIVRDLAPQLMPRLTGFSAGCGAAESGAERERMAGSRALPDSLENLHGDRSRAAARPGRARGIAIATSLRHPEERNPAWRRTTAAR